MTAIEEAKGAAGGICRLSLKHTFYSVWNGTSAEDSEDKSEVICL